MRLAPLLVLFVLLALPHAAAQLPAQPCGPLSIPSQPVPPAEPVAPGEPFTLQVEVENAGSLTATVSVAAVVDQAGWTVVESPEPRQIAPDATSTFSFVLQASEDAAPEALAQFSASGTCDTPLGAQCPGGACVAGSANTQVALQLRAQEGLRIPGLENLDFPPEYLIAAVVLVGLASVIPFAMRRKRGGVVAECPEPLKMLKAGRGTSFPIEIRNPTREPVTAQFEVGPVPEGWSAFMPLPEVQLAGRESRSLWLMVRSPQGAATGESVDVELRLVEARSKATSSLRVRAEVQGAGEA